MSNETLPDWICCPEPTCRQELLNERDHLVCRSRQQDHQFPRREGIIWFAPQFDIRKYDEEYATLYAGLWAYGYQTLHLGENESVYRTVLDLSCEASLSLDQMRVLDLGCGVGRVARDIARRFRSAEVVGLDGSPSMLHLASLFVISSEHGELNLSKIGYISPLDFRGAGLGNVMLFQGDATKTPFRDGIFSLVTCVNLLDRVQSPRQVFDEIARLLKPGGDCILTSPLNWDRSANWDDFPDRNAVLEEFENSGFRITEWFDGLRYREYLDSRGNFSEWNTLVIRGKRELR